MLRVQIHYKAYPDFRNGFLIESKQKHGFCPLFLPIYFSRIILLLLMEIVAWFSSTNSEIILLSLFVFLHSLL